MDQDAVLIIILTVVFVILVVVVDMYRHVFNIMYSQQQDIVPPNELQGESFLRKRR